MSRQCGVQVNMSSPTRIPYPLPLSDAGAERKCWCCSSEPTPVTANVCDGGRVTAAAYGDSAVGVLGRRLSSTSDSLAETSR